MAHFVAYFVSFPLFSLTNPDTILKGAIKSATLFFLGNLLAALGVYVQKFLLLFLSYGFVGGAGLGISCGSPVSPLHKWFPDLRGVPRALIGPDSAAKGIQNLVLPFTFVILGACYVLMTITAFELRMPPSSGLHRQRYRLPTVVASGEAIAGEGKVSQVKKL
ncbi:hypothetical protein HDV00_006943 [Rhizophlyctis rosea]|nr:hypothetical protein HDV00_006943 [Rhizophlyctis rosea]